MEKKKRSNNLVISYGPAHPHVTQEHFPVINTFVMYFLYAITNIMYLPKFNKSALQSSFMCCVYSEHRSWLFTTSYSLKLLAIFVFLLSISLAVLPTIYRSLLARLHYISLCHFCFQYIL